MAKVKDHRPQRSQGELDLKLFAQDRRKRMQQDHATQDQTFQIS